MAQKRKLNEVDQFDDLSTVTRTSLSAEIRGVVTAVSPMKKGKTCDYFNGELADNKARIRLFGFHDNVRQKLLEHQKKQDGVMIAKCEVKQARKGDKLEIMLGKQSEISDCTDTFNISEVEDKVSQLTD